jgi:2,4-dienoyl-CoA reductase-like NADH-dependent reductase (Old Yellow Enzyme family)/thioredoxin reductase
MNYYPHVFQPLRVRQLTLKNRLELTPFVCAQVDSEGGVTQGLIDFIRMQARSGAGNIVLGCITDSNRKLSEYADVDICHDKFVAGLSLLVDEAHKYGAALSYELSHSGRGDVPSRKNALGFEGMTEELPIPDLESASVKVMNREDMDWFLERQVKSCLRAKKAGFDMIFVHAGHNAGLSSWLSPLTNTRTDEYGGSLENRMRFPIEVIKAVRQAVGDMPIEVRASAQDMVEGGIVLEECVEFFKAIEPYIDIAHVSCGCIFHADGRYYTSPMYTMEHKQNVKYSEKVKAALKIPVVVVGNIYNLQDAEDILAAGQADIVGYCRSVLADPLLFVKEAQGRPDTVRPCLRCMDGCGRIFHGLPARCAVNPELGYETEARLLQPVKRGQQVMVIGSGPAGMEAARFLTARGHQVTLYEQGPKLGGRLEDASLVSFKHLMRNYRDWCLRATESCGAKILLNTKVTKELVERERPDAVFVATGSTYLRPPIKGIDGKNVHMLADVESGRVSLGKKLIICGGGLSGIEGAVDLARKGHDVTLIDMIPLEAFCEDLFFFAHDALFKEVRLSGVKLQGDSKILEFNSGGVLIERAGKQEQMEAGACVIALGLQSENALARELYAADPLNTYIIGDADRVRNIRHATRTAYDAVLTMESRLL